MTRFILLSLFFTFITSCKIIKSLHELNREHVKIHPYTLNDKKLLFIPMHHLGKRKFYDDLKFHVKKYKAQGYTVYYELVSTKFAGDSIARDIIRRKVRKIMGIGGGKNYKEMSKEVKYFNKFIQQPPYLELGIDSFDIRADVTYLQLINEWEKYYGPILLDSIDLRTSYTEKYNRKRFFTNDQYKKIIIEYRNQKLIESILSNNSVNGLILFGEGHRKDFKRKIKKINHKLSTAK